MGKSPFIPLCQKGTSRSRVVGVVPVVCCGFDGVKSKSSLIWGCDTKRSDPPPAKGGEEKSPRIGRTSQGPPPEGEGSGEN
jgi:hypothetical protein